MNPKTLLDKLLCVVLLGGVAAALSPGTAFAAVVITEIMYDAPGGDEGHEWVEVTNTGSTPVAINGYKFFESNTNHKLTVVSGSSVLAPNTSAVIANNPGLFAAAWPSFAGTVLKSSFSLSNSGETVDIKNASSSVEDTVSYSSSLGAAGDGASLHRQGGTFTAALPNPGVYPGELAPVAKPIPTTPAPKASKSSQTTTPKTTQKKTSTTPSTYSTKKFLPGQSTAAVADAADVAAQPSASSGTFPALEWLIGLVALVGLGVGAVFLARSPHAAPHVGETKGRADEFEIEGE